MERTDKHILVPWDFTIIAEYALQHAVHFANLINCNILLLHIVKKEENTKGIKDQLEKIIRENERSFNVPTSYLIKQGSIFNTITEVAEEIEAEMVVMGTHGIKGVQKYLGSWALKVIANTQVPFMVVQEAPQKNSIETLMYPINYRRENKESLFWVIQLSKIFNLKVEIYAARYTDRKLKKRVSSNLMFIKNNLDKKNIAYDFLWCDNVGEFPQQVIDHATKTKPDLVLIMTSRRLRWADYMFGANEQYIIANSVKIPILCINPRPLKNVSSFCAGGG